MLRLAKLSLLLASLCVAPTRAFQSEPQPVETSASLYDFREGVVPAFSSVMWEVELVAGRLARIIVNGDGDTDLDAALFDEAGNLIDLDDDLTDYCVLSVVPDRDGLFYVRIDNLGDVYNRYTLSLF